MRSIAAQDRQALASLYDRYASRLHGLALRFLHNPLDAEDLLHDLFIEVWHQAYRYDKLRGSVWNWLALRLRSRAIDRLRSPGYRRLVAMSDEAQTLTADRALWPVELQEGEVMARSIVAVVNELPAETQELLNLVYFKGMSLPDVAESLSLPLGTVKSRLHRALRNLRGAIAGPEDPGRS